MPKCSEVGPFFGLVEMNHPPIYAARMHSFACSTHSCCFFGPITPTLDLVVDSPCPRLSAGHTQTMFVRVQTNFFPSVVIQRTQCNGNCAGVRPSSTVMTASRANRTGGNGYSYQIRQWLEAWNLSLMRFNGTNFHKLICCFAHSCGCESVCG